MRFLNLANRNKPFDRKRWEDLYEAIVVSKIRERYNVNQELAIIRQRNTKPDEFDEYNLYVEKCKNDAKRELYDDI